jgi:ABC-type glycerol-3-phosphate transport system substrate-binding protein
MRRKSMIVALFVATLFLASSALVLAGGGQEKAAPGGAAKPVTITVQMFSGPEYDAMAPTAKYWNENYAASTRRCSPS